jgi:hypothetical protein
MAGKVPYGAAVTMLSALKSGSLMGAQLALYAASHTPTGADTAATYNAIEASFGGYARITLSSWGTPFNNTSNIAEVDEILRTFTATGSGLPQTIYGVYCLDSGGNLLFADPAPAPQILAAAGDSYTYLPIFTDLSRF